jgi:hypothetical protein
MVSSQLEKNEDHDWQSDNRREFRGQGPMKKLIVGGKTGAVCTNECVLAEGVVVNSERVCWHYVLKPVSSVPQTGLVVHQVPVDEKSSAVQHL